MFVFPDPVTSAAVLYPLTTLKLLVELLATLTPPPANGSTAPSSIRVAPALIVSVGDPLASGGAAGDVEVQRAGPSGSGCLENWARQSR